MKTCFGLNLSMKTLRGNIIIKCSLDKYSFLTSNANINGIELENSYLSLPRKLNIIIIFTNSAIRK